MLGREPAVACEIIWVFSETPSCAEEKGPVGFSGSSQPAWVRQAVMDRFQRPALAVRSEVGTPCLLSLCETGRVRPRFSSRHLLGRRRRARGCWRGMLLGPESRAATTPPAHNSRRTRLRVGVSLGAGETHVGAAGQRGSGRHFPRGQPGGSLSAEPVHRLPGDVWPLGPRPPARH